MYNASLNLEATTGCIMVFTFTDNFSPCQDSLGSGSFGIFPLPDKQRR